MANFSAPPPSTNRGVESTSQTGLRACVDWLQVTFKNVPVLQDIVDLLGLKIEDFIEFETGKYGYNYHIRLGHIVIYYNLEFNKDTDAYFHLEMSGQGCREFEQYSSYDWVTLLGLILMLDVNITRLDLALDDFKGYFKISQIVQKVKRGHVRSRFKKARRIEEYDLKDGKNVGSTVYFGRPSSDIQIRFYDKYQERLSAGKKLETGLNFWLRTELQLRDKRAAQAAYELVNNVYDTGNLIKGILFNYLCFLVPSKTDTNKRRWNVCKWWLDFLGDVQKLKLTQVAPDRTIPQVRSWFEDSVSPSFALLLKAFEDEPDLLDKFYIDGLSKMKKKHLNMLHRFLDQKKESSAYEDSPDLR